MTAEDCGRPRKTAEVYAEDCGRPRKVLIPGLNKAISNTPIPQLAVAGHDRGIGIYIASSKSPNTGPMNHASTLFKP